MAVAIGALVLAGATIGIATSTLADAAVTCSTSWKAATSGDWFVAANWSHGVPTSSSDACVGVAGTYSVTVTGPGNVAKSLTLGAGSGVQTLDLSGDCAHGQATLVLSADSTIGGNGAVSFDTSGCANGTLEVDGATLTNEGLVTMSNPPNVQAWPSLSANTVNQGTINVNANARLWDTWTNNGTINLADQTFTTISGSLLNDGAINAAGSGTLSFQMSTFTLATGTTTGVHPVELYQGTFNDSGAGKSTVTIVSQTTTFTGNVARGQTVILDASCTNHFVVMSAAASWTNRGTIILESDGACLEQARIQNAATFTNAGTLRVQPESSTKATSEIVGIFHNNKNVEVASGATLAGNATPFTNGAKATVTIDVASAASYGAVDFNAAPFAAFKLGGTLAISTAAGYWPKAGLTFTILHGGRVRNTFSNVTGLTRAGQAVSYHVNYVKGVHLTTS